MMLALNDDANAYSQQIAVILLVALVPMVAYWAALWWLEDGRRRLADWQLRRDLAAARRRRVVR